MIMIQRAIDISKDIGWDAITDLELAHRFIEESGHLEEFIEFLKKIRDNDLEIMEED